MIQNVLYTGIPFEYLLEEVRLKSSASWRLAEDTSGTTMPRSIPLEKGFDDCLVAVKINSA